MKKILLAFASLCLTIGLHAQELPETQIKDVNSGKKIAFNQTFEKGKVTLISFWATWCVPCKKELENMNEELEFRTRELDSVNSRYAETLERMPWAVTVLDSDGKVQFWNSAAEKLFDIQANSVIGLELSQLPIQPEVRDGLVRRRKAIVERNTPMLLRNQQLKVKRSNLMFDVGPFSVQISRSVCTGASLIRITCPPVYSMRP